MINLKHIKALMLQEFFISVRSYEVLMDVFVFPVMSTIVFGFLASYLSGSNNASLAQSLYIGMILWQIIFIIQYSLTVGSLWNIWSRNLSNMFITPLKLFEYMLCLSISGVAKTSVVFIISSVFAKLIFNFNIFDLGILNLSLYIVNLIFFALSLGLILLGLIFRFGTRIQAFAWGVLPMFQPLSAVFYPSSVLPLPLRFISNLIPVTYVFEAMREGLTNSGASSWNLIIPAFLLNIIYFIFAVIFFRFMFNQSKETGQFAKLEL